MHKGALKAYRNKAYLNCDTGEITKRKSVAMKWEEDGYDVDEVVGTKVCEPYYSDEERNNYYYSTVAFRTMKV